MPIVRSASNRPFGAMPASELPESEQAAGLSFPIATPGDRGVGAVGAG